MDHELFAATLLMRGFTYERPQNTEYFELVRGAIAVCVVEIPQREVSDTLAGDIRVITKVPHAAEISPLHTNIYWYSYYQQALDYIQGYLRSKDYETVTTTR